MKISTIIGTLSGAEEKIVVGGEVFYETNLILNGKSLPARIPEYLSGISGKCNICCTIESTVKNDKMFTFINIMTAERLKDQKTPDQGIFNIIAKIQKSAVTPIPKKGVISVQLVVSILTGIEEKKISTIHVTATDKVARQLAAIPVKSLINLEGQIRLHNGCMYFTATKLIGKE